MTRFGWCNDGKHEACPEAIGGPEGIACTCECHDDGDGDE